MKKTYSFEIKSEKQWKLLLKMADTLEIKFCELFKEEGWKAWTHAHLYAGGEDGVEIVGARFEEGTVCRSFADFVRAMVSNKEKENFVTVKLNDSYDAVIDVERKVVKVGCQVLPFSKVEQVYKAMKKR